MNRPSEQQVQQVMKEQGFDYMQAYRHVQARNFLQQQQHRNPKGAQPFGLLDWFDARAKRKSATA